MSPSPIAGASRTKTALRQARFQNFCRSSTPWKRQVRWLGLKQHSDECLAEIASLVSTFIKDYSVSDEERQTLMVVIKQKKEALFGGPSHRAEPNKPELATSTNAVDKQADYQRENLDHDRE